MFTLHYAPGSRAMRIVWLFEELALPYELRRYGLGGPEMRVDAFRQVNPMGCVPVFEAGDLRMHESGAIVEYLLTCHGDGALRPAPGDPCDPAYLQWLHYAEGMLMPQVNSYMVETFFLPPSGSPRRMPRVQGNFWGTCCARWMRILLGPNIWPGRFQAETS